MDVQPSESHPGAVKLLARANDPLHLRKAAAFMAYDSVEGRAVEPLQAPCPLQASNAACCVVASTKREVGVPSSRKHTTSP